MRDFFKGWRRKVGCLLLMYACATWGCWLMSYPSHAIPVVYVFVGLGGVEIIAPPISEVVVAFLLSAVLLLWPRRRATSPTQS